MKRVRYIKNINTCKKSYLALWLLIASKYNLKYFKTITKIIGNNNKPIVKQLQTIYIRNHQPRILKVGKQPITIIQRLSANHN